jgi:hypothetical protein
MHLTQYTEPRGVPVGWLPPRNFLAMKLVD